MTVNQDSFLQSCCMNLARTIDSHLLDREAYMLAKSANLNTGITLSFRLSSMNDTSSASAMPWFIASSVDLGSDFSAL